VLAVRRNFEEKASYVARSHPPTASGDGSGFLSMFYYNCSYQDDGETQKNAISGMVHFGLQASLQIPPPKFLFSSLLPGYGDNSSAPEFVKMISARLNHALFRNAASGIARK
jgi:hypothetical protein